LAGLEEKISGMHGPVRPFEPSDDKAAPVIIQQVEDAMFRAANEQMLELERNLVFLATTAYVCPFIGLFGTVWGIMRSFVAMSHQGAANISAVAPGIAEALITTVVGLACAIPAVIAYNWFRGRMNRFTTRMENLSSQFVGRVRLILAQNARDKRNA